MSCTVLIRGGLLSRHYGRFYLLFYAQKVNCIDVRCYFWSGLEDLIVSLDRQLHQQKKQLNDKDSVCFFFCYIYFINGSKIVFSLITRET